LQREIQRILIVRTDRIGDVILTLPMARVLKQHLRNAQISMLIRRYTTELVEDDPNVDKILFYDDGYHPLRLSHVIATLRTEKFDVVFHTHPRFRAALMTWLARIPLRVGTGYRWYSFLFNRKVFEHRKNAQRHELEYNLNLLKAIDCPVDFNGIAPTLHAKPFAIDRVKKLLTANEIPEFCKIILLHPGSGGSARNWSAEKFIGLGKRLAALQDVRVVITGGRGEDRLVGAIHSQIGPRSIAIVNQLSLGEYAALAGLAALFVSNSTGPIHIAAAVGTPVIGLYPQLIPLSAARWGPYTAKKIIFAPQDRPPDCRICTGQADSPCECMDSISVDEVYAGAMSVLSKLYRPHSEPALGESSLTQ
jgi:ADP-heptose:LPS heptosyltransferase